MDLILSEIERRVLGVLMEKEMTQPDYYPMTLAGVVAGCNQKQNRDPVMALDDVAVEGSLKALQGRGLVTTLLPAPGARVTRYRHEIAERLHWHKPQRAVMTELLLRGPQTTGELRTRCSRFCSFADIGAVNEMLEALGKLEPPMVTSLPRVPGQAATRYTHLLYPAEERQAVQSAPAAGAPAKAPSQSGEVDVLRGEVAALRAQINELAQRVATLEKLME